MTDNIYHFLIIGLLGTGIALIAVGADGSSSSSSSGSTTNVGGTQGGCPDNSYSSTCDPPKGFNSTDGTACCCDFGYHYDGSSCVDGAGTPVPTPAPTPAPPAPATPAPTPRPVQPGCTAASTSDSSTHAAFRIAGNAGTTAAKVEYWDTTYQTPAWALSNGLSYYVSQHSHADLQICPTPNWPPAGCTTHTMQSGDTCESIAQANNVPASQVLQGGYSCTLTSPQEGDDLLVCSSPAPHWCWWSGTEAHGPYDQSLIWSTQLHPDVFCRFVGVCIDNVAAYEGFSLGRGTVIEVNTTEYFRTDSPDAPGQGTEFSNATDVSPGNLYAPFYLCDPART